MTSKQIIKKVIKFDYPERIGLSFNAPNYDDLAVVGWINLLHPQPELAEWGFHKTLLEQVNGFPGQVYLDVYGTIWGRLDEVTLGEPIKGLLQNDPDDWSGLSDIVLPEIDKNALADNINNLKGHEDKYTVGCLPEMAFRYIRGFENYLSDVLLYEDNIIKLSGKITDLIEESVSIYGKAGYDAVFIWNDWGTQISTLISPHLWRKQVKPLYARLTAEARKWDMDFIFHSCGNVFGIVDDMIDAGVNVLQFDSPNMLGIERLAEKISGRATLYSPVDIQTVLPTGDRAMIEEEARRMIKLFSLGGRGGFIAKDYPDYAAIGVPDEWADWARKVFIKEGGV